MGLVDASRESLDHLLQNNISVCIVVGGAAEGTAHLPSVIAVLSADCICFGCFLIALDARPGTYDLTLSRRFGFIRLAIENGAKLVPVFTFGENDV
jgi:hypothetical protein